MIGPALAAVLACAPAAPPPPAEVEGWRRTAAGAWEQAILPAPTLRSTDPLSGAQVDVLTGGHLVRTPLGAVRFQGAEPAGVSGTTTGGRFTPSDDEGRKVLTLFVEAEEAMDALGRLGEPLPALAVFYAPAFYDQDSGGVLPPVAYSPVHGPGLHAGRFAPGPPRDEELAPFVIAHEVGHHAVFARLGGNDLDRRSEPGFRVLSEALAGYMGAVVTGEAPVAVEETNPGPKVSSAAGHRLAAAAWHASPDLGPAFLEGASRGFGTAPPAAWMARQMPAPARDRFCALLDEPAAGCAAVEGAHPE